jgi:hypothetical protein
MLAPMAGRLSSRLAEFLERLSRRVAAEPPRVETPAEIVDRIAENRFNAGIAMARSDYALEVAANTPLLLRMLALRNWLELRPPEPGPLISVILATRDRPALLPRAIASVLAQRYPRWELVVVDDGDTDAVDRTLADLDADERIVVAEGPRRGLGAARNAGLGRATGEVVCYLDDDNVLDSRWLQAVAHLFSSREDAEVAYGIALTEHRAAGERDEGWWPAHWQMPFSRETLLERNVTDAGALAHRRELDGAGFDEGLSTGEDWDLLLRLTAEREAIAIPAVSHAYAMEGEGRMTEDPEHLAGLEEIRRRHAAGPAGDAQ